VPRGEDQHFAVLKDLIVRRSHLEFAKALIRLGETRSALHVDLIGVDLLHQLVESFELLREVDLVVVLTLGLLFSVISLEVELEVLVLFFPFFVPSFIEVFRPLALNLLIPLLTVCLGGPFG